jgi:hypothetical protein
MCLLAGSGMMEEVYRITGICLGIPPTQFTWQYVDKAKQVRRHFSTSISDLGSGGGFGLGL